MKYYVRQEEVIMGGHRRSRVGMLVGHGVFRNLNMEV